ncbi:MAG: hypothetical protein JXR37_13630 [Kiritimatiellae bacterium]|nr:hypothetical protein [Kiritimatiellia bacterium]
MTIARAELIGRYERLSSAVVYDILDKMGYSNQALSSAIVPLATDMAVAGPAFTLTQKGDSNIRTQTPTGPWYRQVTPGCVVVLATNGHCVSGPWGENTALTVQMKGARGFVTDGGTRDAKPCIDMGFPTFCRFVTPVICSGRFDTALSLDPVLLDGQVEEKVAVAPGDFVLGDADGVVVVPKDRVEEVLPLAERLEEIEVEIRQELREGKDRAEVYQRHPKFAHVVRRR